jgi:predicted ATPase
MSSLDRIEVAGYKSIEKLDLTLSKLNVLIGANGAGKSNFISLFGLLNDLVERRLQEHVARAGGADRLLHFGAKHTPELSLNLQFGQNGYEASLQPSEDDGLFFANERCWYWRDGYQKPYEVPLGSGHRESRLNREAKQPKGAIARSVERSMRSWKIYHFHDTSSAARIKQACDVDDNDFLRPDGANLAAFLYFLEEEHPDEYEEIVQTIRLAAPFFDQLRLRPSPRNKEKIRLEWRERRSDTYFNAHALSDGTLRFIALTTLLLQPSPPTTVVVDEPELGLHPHAIKLLASLLRSASVRTQIIVSTQSVTLVDEVDPEDLIVVDRIGAASSFRRPSQEEVRSWMDDDSLGELWEKNIIGGRPRNPDAPP